MKFQYSPGGLPFVEILLTYREQSLLRAALVDSGSTINVLPYEDGLELGLSWEEQRVPLKDEGFLQGTPVYGIILQSQIGSFDPIKLAFAWTHKSRNDVRLILGQTNFFDFYDITFHGHAKTFDISPRQ